MLNFDKFNDKKRLEDTLGNFSAPKKQQEKGLFRVSELDLTSQDKKDEQNYGLKPKRYLSNEERFVDNSWETFGEETEDDEQEELLMEEFGTVNPQEIEEILFNEFYLYQKEKDETIEAKFVDQAQKEEGPEEPVDGEEILKFFNIKDKSRSKDKKIDFNLKTKKAHEAFMIPFFYFLKQKYPNLYEVTEELRLPGESKHSGGATIGPKSNILNLVYNQGMMDKYKKWKKDKMK